MTYPPTTMEEVLIAATQLLPDGWGVEIIIKKDLLHISCVNPYGEDVDYDEGDSTKQQIMNAVGQACYMDMLDGIDKIEEVEL